MRGEYRRLMTPIAPAVELPPRARRIPPTPSRTARTFGTTSACAENTAYFKPSMWAGRNYLRVRGEYSRRLDISYNAVELPPRARRILFKSRATGFNTGTTSACAENTLARNQEWASPRNYLRVRGEYSRSVWATSVPQELPPRARRIPARSLITMSDCRTTSACAENTLNELGLL